MNFFAICYERGVLFFFNYMFCQTLNNNTKLIFKKFIKTYMINYKFGFVAYTMFSLQY